MSEYGGVPSVADSSKAGGAQSVVDFNETGGAGHRAESASLA